MTGPSSLERTEIELGFIPSLCSAPLILAHARGIFESHGLHVSLRSAAGLGGIKDLMAHAKIDGAHMLAPMPLASSLGIDGTQRDIKLAAILNVNGQALTLAKKHLGIAHVQDMKGMTFGVPYRFSMHYYLLCHYLAQHGVNPLKDVTVLEVAPPDMPAYLEQGWVDAILGPEPFNQIPVTLGTGFIQVLSKEIWEGHPCCCFAITRSFAEQNPNTYRALLRSISEAELALHVADGDERKAFARSLSRPEYLNLEDTHSVEQVLSGEFPDGKGGYQRVPDRIDFVPHPFMECGSWMLSQMQRWGQLETKVDYREIVESTFDHDDVREMATALGYSPDERSKTGVIGFDGEDPFAYMSGQPFCAFRETASDRDLRESGSRYPDRLRELFCSYGITRLTAQRWESLEAALAAVVQLIAAGWSYPEITRARIVVAEIEVETEGFRETEWQQSAAIVASEQTVGSITVCYLEQRPEQDEGPFLEEERELIEGIAGQLATLIDRHHAEERERHLSRVLQAIGNIHQLIVRERDAERLIEQACDLFIETRRYTCGWIAMGERETGPAALAQAGCRESDLSDQAVQGQWPPCRSLLLASEDDVAVLDPELDCQACGRQCHQDDHVAVVTMLRHGGHALGLLGVAFPKQRAMADEEKSLLLQIADDIAFALHNITIECQQSRYAQIVSSSSEAMALVDGDHVFLEANPSYRQLVGWSDREIVGKRVADVLGDDAYLGLVKPKLDQCFAGEDVRFEDVRQMTDGGRRVVEAIYTLCSGTDGTPSAVAACIRDITDLRHTEAALRKEKQFIQNVVDTAQAIILVLDPQGRIVQFNPYFEQLSGVPLEDVRGKDWFGTFIPASDRPRIQQLLRAAVSDAPTAGTVNAIVAKNGEERLIEWHNTTIHDDSGAPLGVLATGQDVTDRVRAVEALQASEAKYRTLYDSSADAIMMLAPPSWRFTAGNAATIEMFGVRDEAALCALGPEHYSPERQPDGSLSGDKAQAMIDIAMREGFHYFEWEHRRLDGREFSATVLLNRLELDGEPLLQATVRDISERKKAQERLQTQAQIISQTNDSVVITDMDGRITGFNRGATTLYGYQEKEVLGQPLDMLLPAYASGYFDRVVRGEIAAKGGLERELVVARKDGSEIDVRLSVSVLRDDSGEPMGAVGYASDITERKQYEAELRASEERFRGVFQGVTDGILLADHDWAFVMANNAMCQMLGYGEDELLALGMDDIHPEGDLPAVAEAFRRQLSGQEPRAHDVPVKRRDKSVFFADVNVTPITVDGRELLMSVFRDVTEKRNLQANVAQADRLASMGMLAAGVAHEINNPLAYILYNLESLTDELPRLGAAIKRSSSVPRDDAGDESPEGGAASLFNAAMFEDVVAMAKDALEGSRRIKDIARGLGTFSRVERDDEAEVDLEYAIECAINMAFNEIKYRARLVKDYGGVPTILASDGRVSQVFLNLLINAAHAIDEGDVAHNQIRIRTWAEDGDVCAEVSDTGKGIAAEHLGRIFEPFFTTKGVGVGSGLGLAICKNIVTGFGGEIDVTSEVGGGSQFTVRLPVRRVEQEAHREVVVPDEPSAPVVRGRILVIDDEEGIRSALMRLLREHDVIAVPSGEDGQSILRNDQAFDVVLCDMMMPRMSGMDVHEWLAHEHQALAGRLVFITGGAFTPRAREYLSKVDTLVVDKPFDLEALRKLVEDRVAVVKGAS